MHHSRPPVTEVLLQSVHLEAVGEKLLDIAESNITGVQSALQCPMLHVGTRQGDTMHRSMLPGDPAAYVRWKARANDAARRRPHCRANDRAHGQDSEQPPENFGMKINTPVSPQVRIHQLYKVIRGTSGLPSRRLAAGRVRASARISVNKVEWLGIVTPDRLRTLADMFLFHPNLIPLFRILRSFFTRSVFSDYHPQHVYLVIIQHNY
ncbi:hypothetical protein BC629DRAFT_1440978 [Irpex lacteus]|nr:hypothetical protein BC629DRAFT_1440978 [Irpex lacteus]